MSISVVVYGFPIKLKTNLQEPKVDKVVVEVGAVLQLGEARGRLLAGAGAVLGAHAAGPRRLQAVRAVVDLPDARLLP